MSFINIKSSAKVLTVVASLLCVTAIVSYFRTEGKQKNLALTVAIGSGLIAATNHLSSSFYEDTANYQAKQLVDNHERETKKLTQDNQELTANYNKQTSQLNTTTEELKAANESIVVKDFTISTLQTSLTKLQRDFTIKSNELDAKLKADDTRYMEVVQEFKLTLIDDLSERIERVYNQLHDSCTIKLSLDNYSKIYDALNKFSQTLETFYAKHCARLEHLKHVESTSIQQFINDAIAIYSEINEEIAGLRVRYRSTLNLDERRSLDDAYELLSNFKDGSVPKNVAQSFIKEQSDANKNKLLSLNDKVLENQNSLSEMRMQVTDLIDEIESKNLQIAELKNEIVKLKQPLVWQFAQGSNELTKGNLIIIYFWDRGVRLDRAFTTGDVYESKIYFHTDNNPRTINFKELNEHAESLQQICLTHKPVTFEWDADKGLMVASLTWKLRVKEQNDELSDESINRIARTWDTWKKHAKKWNRIRITGGSGAGKSPLTERIVSEQLRYKKIKNQDAIKLYNPQSDSRKDNWSFPSIGKTHTDSIRGVAELTALCSQKYQGNFAVWIFDEVDSTLRQAPGKKRATQENPEVEPAMGSNMLSIITQIDHTTQAVFYLGQGANTGKIPGTTKGDWNNLVAIHINGNAKDYLRLADHIDSDSKDKLLKQADTLQRYCDRKNTELGLDRVEPGAYRFALIDEYGEKQYFVMLPLFSADEFLESLAVEPIEVTQVSTDEVRTECATKCKYCGSTNIFKNGKNSKGAQYYSCRDCDNKPKNWTV